MKSSNKILICTACSILLCSCSNNNNEYRAPIVEYRPHNITHTQNLYIVQDGDTVGSIATTNGVTRESLIKSNNLSPPYELIQGQKLIIPIKPLDAEDLNALPHKETNNKSFNISIVQEGGLKTEYGGEKKQSPTLDSSTDVSATKEFSDSAQVGDEALVERSAMQLEDKQELIASDISTTEAQEINTIKYVWPVANGRTRISKAFDSTSGNVLITTPGKTPVKAIADGVVKMAGKSGNEQLVRFGNMIVIQHKELSKVSIYANVIDLKVKSGQKVSAGDTIALVGQKGIRGMTTSPALYFEIDKTEKGKKRQPIDPCSVLP